MKKGHCKHGEVDLEVGCPQCTADRMAEEGNTEAGIAKAIGEAGGGGGAWTALALRPGEDVEAHGYFEESMKLLEYAERRVIASVEDVKLATDDLSLISKLKKVMEDKRKSLLDPLKLQSDAIRATYDYLMMPVLQAGRLTKEQMLAYDAKQKRIRAEQEEINRLREEAAQKQKELTGEITEVDIVEVAPAPAKSVSTDMGSSGLTDHWKYEIVDINLLPREYMIPDTAMLTATARSHHDKKPVAGVHFFNEPYIAVRPK